MNEPLDPKLRELENRLRALRPLEVEIPTQESIQTKQTQRRYFRNILAAVSVTVMILVAVTVFHVSQKQSIVETPEPVAVAVTLQEDSETPVFSTVRSQLVTLLNEMPPVTAEPARREDYPVIEITVTKTASESRDEFSGILRGGSRIDFDPEKPFLF